MSSFASMSYKELQAECKKQNLKASGKTADLVARLTAGVGGAEETKAEPPAPVGPTWSSLLQDAYKSKRLPDATVVVLGEVCREQLLPIPPFLSGGGGGGGPTADEVAILSYGSFEVSEEPAAEAGTAAAAAASGGEGQEDASATRVSVWSLSDAEFSEMLSPVLKADSLKAAAFVVMLDMSKPWTIPAALERWSGVIERQATSLLDGLNLAEQDDIRGAQRTYLQTRYAAAAGVGAGEDEALPALESGVLQTNKTNFGVPIVVVCCRCSDEEASGSKELQAGRFIQLHIRRFLLKYGGALAYVQAALEEAPNCPVLYQYLLHRIYPGQFPYRPEFDLDEARPRNAYFMPSGADSRALQEQHQGEISAWGADAEFGTVVETPADADGAAGGAGGAGGGRVVEDLDDGKWLEGLEAVWMDSQAKRLKNVKRGGGTVAPPPTGTVVAKSGGGKEAGDDASKEDITNFFNSLLT